MATYKPSQDVLVSGTNIKTVNSTSLLGSGDIAISGALADGDKGDIVVSGSGATWTLDETFKTATAGSNGDFYIASAITLATNDIVRISFPAATNGASNARLSIDGGTTYKNIKLSTIRLASEVASMRLSFVYDGTDFVPLETEFFPITYTPTVTASTGTFTTVSTSASYVLIGRQITINFSIVITNKGTATGALFLTTPITIASNAFGVGREVAVAGLFCEVRAEQASNQIIVISNAGTLITNGYTARGTVTYFI